MSGRARRSATLPSSGAHAIWMSLLRRKISTPPGRSRRAASGIHRYGSHQMEAPYSENATSNVASGSGTSSALASMNSRPRPSSAFTSRAVSS